MSVSRILIPGTISQGGGTVSWTNPNNAKVEDGLVAGCGLIGPGGGGGSPNQLNATNLSFGLPSTAIIDGIKLEVKAQTTTGVAARDDLNNGVYLLFNGGNTTYANTPNKGQTFPTSALTWLTYGGPTTLWGKNWTPADINHANFGASLSAYPSTATSAIAIDSIRVTVYYHIGGSTTPADVPIRELYKVYSQSGQYLGLLPNPTEALKIPQDINSLGSQITLKLPVSADTSVLPSEPYTTEDGSENYTNEAGTDDYTTSGQIPIVSAAFQGIDTLIKNGNTVECWVSNYWYPNGKCMFIGKMRRWEADFGGEDCINVLLYSMGYDLDNYTARGAPFSYTTDQSQTSVNAYDTIYSNPKGAGYFIYGQSFKVGAAVSNLGSITVRINAIADITINVYDAPGGNLIGTVTQSVSTYGDTNVEFGFPSLIPVTPGQTLYFDVTPGPGQSAYIIYQNTNVYADGTAYTVSYGGGSGGVPSPITGDLYFVTGYGTPSTTATFTSKDPSTQMLAPFISDYNLRGGTQGWTAASIDATGLSLTYTFNVQTLYEAMKAILTLAPDGFYFYIDLGAQIIYFKNQSTVAEFLLVKGVHINELKLVTTTENSINQVLFTGGDIGGGVNLYKIYNDQASQRALGPLLDRKTDNRVTLDATANAIGLSELAELSGEQYQTTVVLIDSPRLDITQLVPGKVVGFRGFGTFVDTVLAQIVHRDWTSERVVLTLGILPTRLSYEYNQTTRQLIAEQTQNNPGTPT